FTCGSEVTLAAEPDYCWGFESWSGDLVGGTSPVSITMDGDNTIAASFSQLGPYSLTLTGVGSGSVRVDGELHSLPWSGSFACGSEVSLQAESEACSIFDSWSGDASGSTTPVTITIDADKAVEAQFNQLGPYSLTVTGVGSGSVRVDGELHSLPWTESFACGSQVALEAQPEACWIFEEWSGDVAGATNPIDLTIGSDTEIAASFSSLVLFTDVPCGHWALSAIAACHDAGIALGYPDGSYLPGGIITRGPMAVFISRAMAGGDALVPAGPEVASFPDVPTDSWLYNYVEYVKSRQIVQGYPDGSYQPEVDLDRGQMAVFIARALVDPLGEEGLLGYTPPEVPTFPDVNTDFWAYKYIEYIASRHVTQGYPDGSYHPEFVCTRDQMAVYISRAFELPN
ncbi:MAG: S-layer homology domain-containing protein, partial [Proteobacteria bacterium]|nr:S-layer homology domain-containing protein [Pseudomonadota bacterium]